MFVDPNFQTPPAVCEYMVDMIPGWCKTVLEPTPGKGNIVSVLKDRQKFNIITPDDYFLWQPERVDCVVMNPPFSGKSAYLVNAPKGMNLKGMAVGYKILDDCMLISDNVIAVMPWFTISDSDVRLKALKNFGMKSITALPRKTFQYARIQTCVIELEKGFKGETVFRTFSFPTNYNKAQLSLSV